MVIYELMIMAVCNALAIPIEAMMLTIVRVFKNVIREVFSVF